MQEPVGGNSKTRTLTNIASKILVEVRDVTAIPNVLNLCRGEGFPGLKIQHIGGVRFLYTS